VQPPPADAGTRKRLLDHVLGVREVGCDANSSGTSRS
jgi:hypothetical protein